MLVKKVFVGNTGEYRVIVMEIQPIPLKLETIKSTLRVHINTKHVPMRNISLSKDIEPLSEFRKKSADFIKRLKNDKQPIVLTQHGKSAAVLMDVSEYERVTNKLELLEDLLEAKQQVERGETYTMKEARERIEKHLSKWK